MKTIQDELAQVYAFRELNRIDQLRVCNEARDQGLTQSEIARRLSLSQPEVHRILRKIDSFPELLLRTPREVILDFHAERLGHEAMMEELLNWSYTYSEHAEPGNPESELISGSWESVTDAFLRDLIDVEDYERILHTVSGEGR
ncbi:helix-turn-helix domain-containing protein [Glutamicibacter sp. NPDC087344]|uniref:helix-turn-helix domain-containing protein n=1 Tax=Glutamicibacter sp. NPDC087344 TaxID=3363994 RepID=UPI00380467CA